MGLRDEIFQQPETIAGLLSGQGQAIQKVAASLSNYDIQYVFLAARGTSDHAGLYLKYLYGVHNRIPVALAAPSLFSVYQSPPKLKNALVLAISQSGKSPDIIRVVEEGKRQGSPTLAITNSLASPLAQAADFVIDIAAGEEKAVAATKTYTAELMAIALLSVALAGDEARRKALEHVPGYIDEVLKVESLIAQIVERYYYMASCAVLGRGYNYATAFEWSLKMKELAYIVAMPYSSADFMHGPIAIVERAFPVMALMPDDVVFVEMLELVQKLKDQHQAEVLVLSNCKEALKLGSQSIPLPNEMPAWLSPIVSIVPAQLFCYHLTHIKGFDTEKPRSITKVTETV